MIIIMIEIFTQKGDEARFSRAVDAALASRSWNTDEELSGRVRKIIDQVAKDKDEALIRFAKEFDGVTLTSKTIEVTQAEIEAAYDEVSASALKAIREAIKGIRAFHLKQKKTQPKLKGKSAILALREVPVETVGVYVPGGRAAYPSTVLMNLIPAMVAGVKKIIMVTPASKNSGGKISPLILAAANEVASGGKTKIEIYKVGGAQAIAALAFGTESIPKVDLIVGPGNAYVTMAKKQLFGFVGIDKLAGPSDVVVLADEIANAAWVAMDLQSQMEHDPDAAAYLVTTSEKLAQEVKAEIKNATKQSAIFVVKNLEEGIRVVNEIAPEHLEVIIKKPASVLDKIINAGAIFMGEFTPVAMGDYGVGPNHVLPAGGTARFASVLTVADFMKRQSVMALSKTQFKQKALMVETFANLEGFAAHEHSVMLRRKSL